MMITPLSVYTLRNLSLEERERLGCVVLVTRRWPRGIRHSYAGRSVVDYWLKEAGPSPALLAAYQHGHCLSWEALVEKYLYWLLSPSVQKCRIEHNELSNLRPDENSGLHPSPH